MVEPWTQLIPPRTSPPWYILVQAGQILDVVTKPQGFMWSLVDEKQDFQVLVGVINEFGNHEIIGPCAEYAHGEGNKWLLTSPLDGFKRMVGITGTPVDCISNRLSTMYMNKRLDDPVNFDKVLLRTV